jgi:cell division protein FtsQ
MNAATIGIDPRIRARRVAVLRAEGRRRLRLVLVVTTLAVAIAAAWTLSRSVILDVDRVHIDGVDGPAAALVREVAGVPEGVALLDVDTGAIEARLERLPWVKEADVRRKWPGTLVMTVVERTAIAVVPSGTGLALLDEDGVVMARESLPTAPTVEGLPVVAVPLSVAVGAVHLDAGPGLAVVAALTADLEPWVEAVLVGDGHVGLDLVGGATVSMGPAVRLDDKVSAVRAVLAGVDLSCIRSIDVTAADQTMVRRDLVCDAAARATTSDA